MRHYWVRINLINNNLAIWLVLNVTALLSFSLTIFMTVLICNDVPPQVRGAFKRWFIEPRPNVFVGTLNVRNHRKVKDFILRNAPKDFGMLVISSAPNSQGYTIERYGPEGKTGRRHIEISGISLIAESWRDVEDLPDSDNCPF